MIALNQTVKHLRTLLFEETNCRTFAVLDGAALPDLLDRLAEASPDHVCLYRGELAPDMRQCAPYLVELQDRGLFTDWVLSEAWGSHAGIFVSAADDLRTLRQHFRRFSIVQSPDGKPLYFRYYDPRVLRVYLPTCNRQEMDILFGPVRRFVMEDEGAASALMMRPGAEAPMILTVDLASAAAATLGG